MALTVAAPASDRYALPGLMLHVLYAVAVFRIRLPAALLPAGAVIAAYVVAVGPSETPGQLAFDVIILGSMIVIGLLGVVVLERSSRERFLQRRVIEAQREEVAGERAKSDALLRAILPASIVARLRERPEAVAEGFDAATLIFADLVGFTGLAERLRTATDGGAPQHAGQPLGRAGGRGRRGEDQDDRRRVLRGRRRARAAGRPCGAGRRPWPRHDPGDGRRGR